MPRQEKTINAEIGGRIRELRNMRKLSREDLAQLSGYSVTFIQEVERGRSGLSSESIRALSVALKTSADYILFGDRSEEYSYILERLKSVPLEKREHVLNVIEETIACTQ